MDPTTRTMHTTRSSLARPGRIALAAAAAAALAAVPLGAALAESATGDAVETAAAVESVPMVEPLTAPTAAAPAPAPEAAPLPAPAPVTRTLGSGMASYYGAELHGRRTASGERFDMHEFTAAHRTLPFGTRVVVTNPSNGRSVTVRINDRGPFHGGRVIDLSRAAATELGLVARGHGHVELALVEG